MRKIKSFFPLYQIFHHHEDEDLDYAVLKNLSYVTTFDNLEFDRQSIISLYKSLSNVLEKDHFIILLYFDVSTSIFAHDTIRVCNVKFDLVEEEILFSQTTLEHEQYTQLYNIHLSHKEQATILVKFKTEEDLLISKTIIT